MPQLYYQVEYPIDKNMLFIRLFIENKAFNCEKAYERKSRKKPPFVRDIFSSVKAARWISVRKDKIIIRKDSRARWSKIINQILFCLLIQLNYGEAIELDYPRRHYKMRGLLCKKLMIGKKLHKIRVFGVCPEEYRHR